MRIGLGWYEDYVKKEEEDDLNELASQLLKDKLDEVFGLIRNNSNSEKMAVKGKIK